MAKLSSVVVALSLALLLGTVANSAHAGALGLQAGINSASSTTTVAGLSASSVSVTKPMFGVYYESGLNPIMHLQIEANYVPFSNSVTVGTAEFKGLTYLSVPIFLKAKLAFGLPIKPFFMAGPDLMLKIAGDYPVSGSTYKSAHFALDFGGGLELDIAPLVSLVASARYSMGLTNVLENTAGAEVKLKGVQILGGLSFGF